jgi:hypothetical protein
MSPEEESVVEEEVDSSYVPSIGRYIPTGIDPSSPAPFCTFTDLLPVVVKVEEDEDDL